MTTNCFSPLSFVAVFGSGIQDPGSGMGKNQDPGSGINISDPQHCCIQYTKQTFCLLRSEHYGGILILLDLVQICPIVHPGNRCGSGYVKIF
jgi:hypothetical protein